MCSKRITPNIVTCNILINRLLKAGETERAKVLFDGISQKGSTPNDVTYATMIDGYCKSENVNATFRLLDEMQLTGISPDNFVIALLNGCCKERELEKDLD